MRAVAGALALTSLGWLWLQAPPVEAAELVEGGRIAIHYKNASLSQIIEEIARATGEVFTFDRALPGRFTITIGQPVTRDEALAVLDATLMMQGYAILRGDDGVNKVLPVTDAATGSRWRGPAAIGEGDKLVTTMVHLENAAAETVSGQMQHLVSEKDRLIAYTATNSLILVGSEKRVRNMLELAQALDAGGLPELWLRTLRHRGVVEASELLREVIEPLGAATSLDEQLRILPDERTNTLILMGTKRQLAKARVFIEELDKPPTVDTRIQVVHIYHRLAKDLEDNLIQLAVGRAINAQNPAVGENLLGRVFMVVADVPTNSLVIDADRDTFKTIMRVPGQNRARRGR